MAKTHYGSVDRANESDNNDYWSATLCGIEETESPMTDRENEVTCKKCLRAIAIWKKTRDKILINSFYEAFGQDFFYMHDPELADEITKEGNKTLNELKEKTKGRL